MPSPYAGYMANDWSNEEKDGVGLRIRECLNYSASFEAAGFPPNYFLQDEDNPGLMMGVELEVSTSEPPREFTWNTPFPAIYAKPDSSISSPGFGGQGFELVTVPADMAHQKAIWANVFRNTKGCDVYRDADTTNGLHIHLDQESSFEDDEHLKKFCAFFLSSKPKQKAWLMTVAQRTQHSFDSYCHTARRNERLNTMSIADMREIFSRRSGGHYAVCFSRYNTVELRVFRGVYSYASMLSAFEFLEAIVQWTKDSTMEEVYNHTGGLTPGRRFHEWVLADTDNNKWRYLKASFRVMQTFFETEAVVVAQEEIEGIRSGRLGAEEGEVFTTEAAAQYACRFRGTNILSYVQESDERFRIVWSSNVFGDSSSETAELLERSMQFREENTKKPRLEEVDDDSLEAYSWGRDETPTTTTTGTNG